ncbi:MAG TPA: hypothetical protein VLS89_12635 [Candidatus Nanopelagicales bacterium]|nr:hypothetical protein [Candidatus Nanopelagicales bacterium]
MKATHRIASMGMIAAALCSAADGWGQSVSPDVRGRASTLYEVATDEMRRGDFAAACPRLEEVVRLMPEGVPAKLTLASCFEADGRLASAWSTYLAAEAAAARAQQRDNQKLARQRAEALRPRLAWLALVVFERVRDLADLRIAVDDVPLGAAQWNMAFPVDRGVHHIVVTAEGRRPWEGSVEVGADADMVSVEIGEPSEAPTAAEAAASPARRSRGQASMKRGADRPEEPGAWSSQHVLGAMLGGMGFVSLGIGAATFGLAAVKLGESNDLCNPRCDKEGLELRSASLVAGDISMATVLVGAAALTGGVALFWWAPSRDARASARVVVGSRLEIQGRF